MEMPGPPEASPPPSALPSAPATPRQTLAMRMAERSRLRAERAERLARLAPVRSVPGSTPEPEAELSPVAPPRASAVPAAVRSTAPEPDAAAALEEFLRSLTRGLGGQQPPPPPLSAPAPLGEVLPFQRPAPPGPHAAADAPGDPGVDRPCDLARLQGVGPGLVWALRRAGIPDLASVAALEPEALAARLGPLGRLVPARAWVEAARTLDA